MVMLKQCCCGCTLKTGALIIAVVFAILAALQLVIYSVAAVEASEKYDRMTAHWEILVEERLTGTVAPIIDEDGHPLPTNDTGADPDGNYRNHQNPIPLETLMKLTLIWKWCMIVLSITETLSFFLNILLMFAANKDSAPQVLMWLFGFLGTSCSRLLLQLIMAGTIFYQDAIVGGFIVLALLTFIALGAAYSLVVVQSYYRHLVGTGIARRISRQDD